MTFFRSYNNKSDEQLMILVQRGDHRAFSAIYDRYSGKMKAYFYRMLWSDATMAEDYVHDLFAKVVERPELFNPDKLFASWLFQVASNMCKNAYRKREFEVEYLNQLKKNGIQQPSIEREMDEAFLTNRLHKILEQLGEEKRDLFLLRYQQQLSIEELSQIYETSEGTIKSRLFYIRKTLMEILGENKIIWENGR